MPYFIHVLWKFTLHGIFKIDQMNTVLAKQRKLQIDYGIFYSSSTINQTLITGKKPL